jgi:hypothetical protein
MFYGKRMKGSTGRADLCQTDVIGTAQIEGVHCPGLPA